MDDDLFSMLPSSSKKTVAAAKPTISAASSVAPSSSSSSRRDDTTKGKKRAVKNEEEDGHGHGHGERSRKQRRSEGQETVHEAMDEDEDEDNNENEDEDEDEGESESESDSEDEDEEEEEDDDDKDDPMAALERNRLADETMDGDQTMDGDESMMESSVPSAPVVTDDYELEAEREVAASKGFAATDEGEKMKLVHQVRHQVALPPNYPYVPISSHVPKDPPARTYKFTLDPFQRVAVNSIERNESVLVSAHTSAGKTVVAEYAIATCLKEGKRVVYTSPIKALSNQKFRELQEEFVDVGLMTGDVTINPGASCLVMTTEILRSMLYRGSEIMREVAWVIFDEIHYMRDKERGVVWEETIILLPDKVRYVFLSATIPNSMQFAEWIVELHQQPCHVVYTDFRPTPLQHYMFPEGGDGMYLVVDEKGVFREDNFQKAMGSLAELQGEDPADPRSGGGSRRGKTKKGGAMKGGVSDIYKLVKMIMAKNLNPVIIFAFSKRECEALAQQMSKLDMNTEDEANMVVSIFDNAMSGLTEEDRALPQIQQILPLLKRGIGIHHGGLLPILKEVIEILFQEGLIKALFATETFSIGLNMPAKTVVFTSVTKFDGKEFRHLSGGEYIQMSGRAGRRGLDARGIVIMMCDTKLEPEAAKGMVKGQADRLDSAFHLGYNMVLNLMRVEGVSPEYMLQKCFYQFQNTMNVPVLETELKALERTRKSTKIKREEEISEYYDLKQHLEELMKDYRTVINHPAHCLTFIQPGRLVHIVDGNKDFGWGAVVHYEKRWWPGQRGGGINRPVDTPPQQDWIIMVLLNVATGSHVDMKDKAGSLSMIQPATDGEKSEPVVVPVLLSCLHSIAQMRIFMPKDLRPLKERESVWKAMGQVFKRFPKGITLLDPIENMNIKDESFKKLIKKIALLDKKLSSLKITASPDLTELYEEYRAYVDLKTKIKEVKRKISAVHNVLQLDELKNRKRVLRRLGFTTSDDVIETKGRVACEISTGDELLLTEMIFSGVFNPLTPSQCAALLSCFVFDEKAEMKGQIRDELGVAFRKLTEHARYIAQVSTESKIALVPEEYINSFKPALMEPVYKWCHGASFAEICKMADVFEGSIIRCFRRLQELIRQMGLAATAIGNTELEEKFAKSLEELERPNTVVFNPSLYL